LAPNYVNLASTGDKEVTERKPMAKVTIIQLQDVIDQLQEELEIQKRCTQRAEQDRSHLQSLSKETSLEIIRLRNRIQSYDAEISRLKQSFAHTLKALDALIGMDALI
jgi:predicted  nucleic acid-binding Zn-ribbon protein